MLFFNACPLLRAEGRSTASFRLHIYIYINNSDPYDFTDKDYDNDREFKEVLGKVIDILKRNKYIEGPKDGEQFVMKSLGQINEIINQINANRKKLPNPEISSFVEEAVLVIRPNDIWSQLEKDKETLFRNGDEKILKAVNAIDEAWDESDEAQKIDG